MMKKRCQREPGKSCFLIQIRDMGLPGSSYPQIFDVLRRCQKMMIFGHPPDGPKNRDVERQGVAKATNAVSWRQVSGREGSPG